jgi:hypothetical protein
MRCHLIFKPCSPLFGNGILFLRHHDTTLPTRHKMPSLHLKNEMLQGSELMPSSINPIHFLHLTFISQLSTLYFYKAFTFPPTLYHSVPLWSSSLRSALIGAKSCNEKLSPQLFFVCLPALSIKSCSKNRVCPISTFHRKVEILVVE